MEGVIVYDNTTAGDGIRCGWGFSCLLDRRILFDTGQDPESLLHNLQHLGLDIDRIEAVVISHPHWDHIGGLGGLLARRPGLPVYICPGFEVGIKQKIRQLGGNLIESAGYRRLDADFAVTGEISARYKGAAMPEQGMMVKTDNGINLITGCSHPGIVPMVQKTKSFFPDERIHLVLGGFHLLNENRSTIEHIIAAMIDLGVEKVGPTHCTGRQAQMMFEQRFGDRYIPAAAGKTFEM